MLDGLGNVRRCGNTASYPHRRSHHNGGALTVPPSCEVCGTKMRPNGELPSDPQAPTSPEAMQKARLAVHHRSACSGVKALRNTSDARRQAAKLCYRFGPLTPSARSANLIAGDGTKNGFPAPNKEPAKTKNHHLTGKAPYKFESISLQRGVSNEPCGWPGASHAGGTQSSNPLFSTGESAMNSVRAVGVVPGPAVCDGPPLPDRG